MASRAASGEKRGNPGHDLRQFFLAAPQEGCSPWPRPAETGLGPTAGAAPGRVL